MEGQNLSRIRGGLFSEVTATLHIWRRPPRASETVPCVVDKGTKLQTWPASNIEHAVYEIIRTY
jgi:hypothetical protein